MSPSNSPATDRNRDAGAPERPVVLLFGFAEEAVEGLRALGEEHYELVVAEQVVGQALALERIAVLCAGEGAPGEAAHKLLTGFAASFPNSASMETMNIVLAGGPSPELFQDLVDGGRLFHLCQESPPIPEIARLIADAVRSHGEAQSGKKKAPANAGRRPFAAGVVPAPGSRQARPATSAESGGRPIALLFGFATETIEALRALGEERCELWAAEQFSGQALPLERIAVLCTGEGSTGEAAHRLLSGFAGTFPGATGPLNVVLASGPSPEIFQDLSGAGKIFHLSQEPPPLTEIAQLLGDAADAARSQDPARAAQAGLPRSRETPAPAETDRRPPAADRQPRPEAVAGGIDSRRLVELLRLLALQQDPADVAELLATAAQEILDAQRVHCLLYDPIDDMLWTRTGRLDGAKRKESASSGVAGAVLAGGRPIALASAAGDRRYQSSIDDPMGSGDERLLAVPMPGDDGTPTAILVAVREAEAPEFDAGHQHILEQLAAGAAPYLTALLPQPGRDGEENLRPVLPDIYTSLFRRDALDHHLQASDEQRDPLMISPGWSRWSYWSLVVSLVAALAFTLIGEINEYATGPAVVWMGGRVDLTAISAGTVATVEVQTGQRVEPGQILLRFHEAQEAAEVERISQEFEQHLINRMRDPTDPGPEQALISLRAQHEAALARLEERTIRAPVAGTVSDVRSRPRQFLSPGQPVLSLIKDDSDLKLMVIAPGKYRPLFAQGMRIRFTVSGYSYAYQYLEVETVGDEVVGPNEVRRFLGPAIADSFLLSGPVVLLEARLPSLTFEAEGKTYNYHNGMQGVADIRVRSEKILFTLLPGLKALLPRGHA